MKKLLFVFLLLSVFLASCAPQAPEALTAAPTEAPIQAAPTETTLPPTAEPTLAPVLLVGPEMKRGSTYLYVDGSILVAVPAGEFTMGNGGDDNPIRRIYLSDFWIYRFPVTNAQYARCVEAGNCLPPDVKINQAYTNPLRANDPVVGIDHSQAAAYCSWVSGRLPTEAEWEKTARGPDGNIYPWGDAAPSCDLLNFGTCVTTTTEVNKYPQGQSFYGAFDMAGNVFEWVADWYKPGYYTEAPDRDPLGPDSGIKRSVRSNSFSSAGYLSESARRFASNPGDRRNDLGFRCVVEDPTGYAPFCQTAVVYEMPPNANASGEIPAFKCPDLSISQGSYCGQNNTPLTNITFSGPDGAAINAGGCTLVSGNLYVCSSPGSVEICAKCEAGPVGAPTCAPSYTLSADGSSCVYNGSVPPGTACLPGFTYNAANNCCQALPSSNSYPLCPAGTYAVDGKCYPYPAVGTLCQTAQIKFKSCTGGGNPGGCPPGQTLVCRPDPNCPPTVACQDICTCQ